MPLWASILSPLGLDALPFPFLSIEKEFLIERKELDCKKTEERQGSVANK